MTSRSTKRVRLYAMRRVVLLAHRYVGLALVPFLIVLGLTGSIITFNVELEARLAYIVLRPGQAIARMKPRSNTSGKTSPIDFDQIFLDPFTGAELGRRREGDLFQGWINLMPFIYRLHRELAAGRTGVLILGGAALVWTLDCFAALYLSLPLTVVRFWRRWSRSWRVRKSKNSFRLNFDL